jgi:hypothetical protein
MNTLLDPTGLSPSMTGEPFSHRGVIFDLGAPGSWFSAGRQSFSTAG